MTQDDFENLVCIIMDLMDMGVEPTSACREVAYEHGMEWGSTEMKAFVKKALAALSEPMPWDGPVAY